MVIVIKFPRTWKNLCLRWMLMLLCAALLIPAAPAQAQIGIDPTAVGSLSVVYDPERLSEGVRFALHRVANVSAMGEYILTESYSNYPVTLNNLNSEGWRSRAITLEGYTIGNQVDPMREAYTDGSGYLMFRNLPVGLYLLSGETVEEGDQVYGMQSFLVSVPGIDEEGKYTYSVQVMPKFMLSSFDETDFSVYVVWDDENNEEKKRPDSVVIKLYENNEMYDVVELSDDNSWRYSWRRLSKDRKWTVVQDSVPEGYKIYITQDDDVFIVTNEVEEPEEPADEPQDVPDKPNSSGGSTGGTSSGGGSSGGRLPQTGLLWWPVPLLAALGMMMFLIGWIQQKREEKK